MDVALEQVQLYILNVFTFNMYNYILNVGTCCAGLAGIIGITAFSTCICTCSYGIDFLFVLVPIHVQYTCLTLAGVS